jgi:hypothetical protein
MCELYLTAYGAVANFFEYGHDLSGCVGRAFLSEC